ncbi:VWA domain-containing protein [Candidatus Poribacteria bacterium]|nr:VWA domain-containing protein [Candidatus Poribacteria bacterium]
MRFLSPTAFALFSLAVPIVILYILKLRRRRQRISTLMFWEQIFKEKQTTALFQKLKHLLSILLQLLFLAFLVLALAQPQLGFMTKSARQIILIIDRSASMNSIDASETSLSRLESVKQKSLKIVDSLRFIDEMMVISCHNHPLIHSPFTNHQKSLRGAIRSIQPTDVKTDLEPALDLAYAVAQTKPNAEILLFSDFQQVSESLLDKMRHPPSKIRLHLLQVGSDKSDNVGITRFRVHQSLANAFEYQMFLSVTNTSEAEKKFNLELYLDDNLNDVRPYKLSPGETKSEIFSNLAFEGSRLKAVLDIKDALPSDNLAYAPLPKREKIPVLLVTRDNPFLQNALSVDEKLDLTVVSPEKYNPSNASGYSLVIFDRFNPPTLGEGNYMFVYPPNPPFPPFQRGDTGGIWEIGKPLESPIVSDWVRNHPILNYVNLENVSVAEAYRVEAPPTAQVLVRSFEDPLLIVDSTPNRRIVFVAMNILKSDLPLRIAFPVMIANTIQWFQSPSQLQEHHLHTGEVLRKRLHLGVGETVVAAPIKSVTITGPQSQSWEIPVEDNEILFDQTSIAGFYILKFGAQEEIWAVNLADESESNIRTVETVKELLAKKEDVIAETHAPSLLLRYPPWSYLIFLAIALSAVEWFLYQRRRIE